MCRLGKAKVLSVSLNGLKSNVIYSGMKLKIPNK